MVSGFEKRVETLKDKRDGVLLDVDAAEKNGKNIYTKLSKKVEEDVNVIDELLQQDGFDKVSYRDVLLPIVVVPLKDFEDFDSRKLIFNKIMEAVKDPNVNIIGVHEMLGVSKTTLMKEVKIQDQIVDMLGLKFEKQSVTGRASRLCQRLKKEKNILVVLDDIWAKLDMIEVGIPLGDEDQRCTILLTSRDLNVLLKDIDAKKSFPIDVLEHEEAWHFFNKIIGDGVEISDLLLIATKVAKKCGGIPIAIRTLASSLRNKPPYVWEDALRQLRLFHGLSTIKETRDKLLTVVRHLKASCLLLDGNTSMQFDIHDLISDVAKSITSKGSLEALCLINCVLGYITLIGELKNLEIVIITSSDIEVLAKEIGQLTKLKQLDLRGCSKLRRIPLGVLCKLSSISVFIFIKREEQVLV
ncbi:hypothetical protein Gogos_015304 [Gossypium gossypioides]|uniref:NB-ARC domain-containing protein n=1 Tax=Gossypium gossypioides TaxID=34282 RepID=A0A7J9C1C7_GOSGO|nr:hypothetical protein [Gossypium gossypioides]